MGTEAKQGAVLGIVPEGQTLAGWEIVATGDGGAITMKTGNCWGRWADWEGDANTAWDAVTARLWARLTDAQVLAQLGQCERELAGARGRMAKIGARAALRATVAEATARGLVG